MKRILTAATIGLGLSLAACVLQTVPIGTDIWPPVTAEPRAIQTDGPREFASGDAARATDSGPAIAAACQQFNAIYADYKAIDGDPNAYEEIYFAAQDAKDPLVGQNIRALFASLSLLTLERTPVDQEPDQEYKDLVRDAVWANAPACTAEGITLRL